ncbi:MAG: hypothetical protein OXC31_17085 [Spirochaetaceae bacterium]|nr:hypothetical protein [Spirochaetaceae bacterium]
MIAFIGSAFGIPRARRWFYLGAGVMGSTTRRKLVFLPIALTALVSLAGCDRKIEIRSYREVTVAPTPVGALFDSTGSQTGSVAGSDGNWRWVTPADWSELPGDGLRVARFGLPGGGESTLVVLAGDAGGVEANVRRWLTQLGLDLPPERVRSLLDDATAVRGNLDFTLFDFTPLVSGRDQTAFLAAIASAGGQTMFVKAEAPAGVLGEQRAAFIELLSSLGPRSSTGGYGSQE